VINPAWKGTVGLLEAAQRHGGAQLRTFVYMSSLVTLLDPASPPCHKSTADSWNTTTELMASKWPNHEEIPFSVLYPASKILAERAVFDFRLTVKPMFRVLSVAPGVVIGPPILLPERIEEINGTIKPIWEVLSGENKGMPRKVGSGMFVDVRDLAGVCAEFVEKSSVTIAEEDGSLNGRRIIAVAGRMIAHSMAKELYGKYPETLTHLERLVKRDGDEVEEVGPTFDTRDAEKALGRSWTTYEQSVSDTAKLLERYLD
jgi:nucleoside-diphosphate-sugar epimerase